MLRGRARPGSASRLGLRRLAVARRETNGWKWPAFMVAYLFALAYVFAGLTFWIATALGL